MKKGLYFVICMFVLLVLTGCGEQTAEKSETITEKMNQDKVVQLDKVDISHLTDHNVIRVESQPSFAYSGQTVDDVYSHSDLIVQGKVSDTYFTTIDGMAYTVMEFEVEDVLKGNAEKNSTITTLTLGGYTTLREHIEANDDAFRFADISEDKWDTTYLESYTLKDGYPKKGEKYVLALVDDSTFVKGVYSTLNIYEGMFKYDNGQYRRTLPEQNYYGNKKKADKTYFQNDTAFQYKWFKEKCNEIKTKK